MGVRGGLLGRGGGQEQGGRGSAGLASALSALVNLCSLPVCVTKHSLELTNSGLYAPQAPKAFSSLRYAGLDISLSNMDTFNP